jgi:phage/plasmid-like protein (TIGR03299 family)
MPERTDPPASDSDARFLGWQVTASGGCVPLFNITATQHPSYRSTVSAVTLRRLHLRVPETPSPNDEAGPSPWHNLATELNHPKTAREAIKIAGLDYTVEKRPLESITGLKQDAYAIVRTDTGDVLGVVPGRYEPVQNRDAFAFFDVLVGRQQVVYETAGVIGHGERVWILAKLSGHIIVHGNDIVNKYLLLTNSHDGSVPVQIKVAPIRLVCNNTLTCALQGMRETYNWDTAGTTRHVGEADNVFALTNMAYQQLEVTFNSMAAKKITENQLREYVQTLVPETDAPGDHAKSGEMRNDVLRLYDSGRGAYLARGTWWGAFNGVTEYTDYIMSAEDPTQRLHSMWFGRGEQFKLKAFDLARRMTQEGPP